MQEFAYIPLHNYSYTADITIMMSMQWEINAYDASNVLFMLHFYSVINFFSLPSDDECLSDDGLRIGLCMNVYECRLQGIINPFNLHLPIISKCILSCVGGTSKGDCALGFGACCVCKLVTVVFIQFQPFDLLVVSTLVETTCDQEIHNNITYFVSPKFPALMSSDRENCSIKIKLMSDDISQIRLDFLHFTMVSSRCFNLINCRLILHKHLWRTRITSFFSLPLCLSPLFPESTEPHDRRLRK